MRDYIALIHKDKDSAYGVSFPDFPGCISAGSTLDEARSMAQEALAFHIEGMIQDGDPIPEPSSLEQIMADAENRDGVATLIPAPVEPSPVVRVNITLPQSDLEAIDQFAEANGYSRSGFLNVAAKRMMKTAA
jgi:predicted RNase H-like HicB family nuclease